jgi:hypothetical protein
MKCPNCNTELTFKIEEDKINIYNALMCYKCKSPLWVTFRRYFEISDVQIGEFTLDDCGNECKIPFKPKKNVYYWANMIGHTEKSIVYVNDIGQLRKKDSPMIYNKFAFENWQEIDNILNAKDSIDLGEKTI